MLVTYGIGVGQKMQFYRDWWQFYEKLQNMDSLKSLCIGIPQGLQSFIFAGDEF